MTTLTLGSARGRATRCPSRSSMQRRRRLCNRWVAWTPDSPVSRGWRRRQYHLLVQSRQAMQDGQPMVDAEELRKVQHDSPARTTEGTEGQAVREGHFLARVRRQHLGNDKPRPDVPPILAAMQQAAWTRRDQHRRESGHRPITKAGPSRESRHAHLHVNGRCGKLPDRWTRLEQHSLTAMS